MHRKDFIGSIGMSVVAFTKINGMDYNNNSNSFSDTSVPTGLNFLPDLNLAVNATTLNNRISQMSNGDIIVKNQT